MSPAPAVMAGSVLREGTPGPIFLGVPIQGRSATNRNVTLPYLVPATVGDTVFLVTVSGAQITAMTDTQSNAFHEDVSLSTTFGLWKCVLTHAVSITDTLLISFATSSLVQAAGSLYGKGILNATPTAHVTGSGASVITESLTLTAGTATDLWIHGGWLTAIRTPTVTPGAIRAKEQAASTTQIIGDYIPGSVGPHSVTYNWTGTTSAKMILASYAI